MSQRTTRKSLDADIVAAIQASLAAESKSQSQSNKSRKNSSAASSAASSKSPASKRVASPVVAASSSSKKKAAASSSSHKKNFVKSSFVQSEHRELMKPPSQKKKSSSASAAASRRRRKGDEDNSPIVIDGTEDDEDEEMNDAGSEATSSSQENEATGAATSAKVKSAVDADIPIADYSQPGGVPVFRPTWSQFRDFARFIEQVNTIGEKYGLIKVVAPVEYKPNRAHYHDVSMETMQIHHPIRQNVTAVLGLSGAYQVMAVDELVQEKKESITVPEFQRRVAESDLKRSGRERALVDSESWDELERKFWSQTLYNPPLYGADTPGTLFDSECAEWNVGNLPSLLHAQDGPGIPGVSLPMLYFGSWKSMFAWHIEDVNLASINYLHFGSPKQWYGIAPSDADKFDRAMKQIWPQSNCSEFIRHKESLVSPLVLKEKYGIKVMKTRQNRGEFVVLWPRAYHSGFNYGFNCAESVNFATGSWFKSRPAGKCLCRGDTVWINSSELTNRLRKLQYLAEKERVAEEKQQKSRKEYSIDDVPDKYRLDESSIWLSLPTNPQQLKALTEKYYPPDDNMDTSHQSAGRSMTGRSMTGRPFGSADAAAASSHADAASSDDATAAAASSSSSNNFLFNPSSYNERNVHENDEGYSADANAVFCIYADCTQPLHANQVELMRHYSIAHSKPSSSSAATSSAATPAPTTATSTTPHKRKAEEEKSGTVTPTEQNPQKKTKSSTKK